MTEIAFPGVAVPSSISSLVFRRATPADELLRYDTILILKAHEFIKRIAIDIRAMRTGPRLQVMRKPRRAHEVSLTERTCQLGTTVNPGVEVLLSTCQQVYEAWGNRYIGQDVATYHPDSIVIDEGSGAGVTIVMVFYLVSLNLSGCRKRLVTNEALMCPVVKSIHVLDDGAPAPEVRRALIALMLRADMVECILMLLPSPEGNENPPTGPASEAHLAYY